MIADSGERRTFDTGAQRDRQVGKGRMDLLPYRALIEVSKLFEEGAIKYASRNWEKGMPVKEFLDSGARHHAKCMVGKLDEPHLVQWCWNSLCALDTYLRIKEGTLSADLMDDLPFDRFLLMGEEPGDPVGPIDKYIKQTAGPTDQRTDVPEDEHYIGKYLVGTWWKTPTDLCEIVRITDTEVFYYVPSRNRTESTSLINWRYGLHVGRVARSRMPFFVWLRRWWNPKKRTTA